MRLLFAKSNWEVSALPLGEFLQRAAADGFGAAEVFLPARPEPPREVGARTRDAGMELIVQINTSGSSPADHIAAMERHLAAAVEAQPLFVCSHTGSDLFPHAENVRIFEHADDLARAAGLPIHHETHRGRALFSGPATRAILTALPSLTLTADFAHWFCVHESDLSNQPETVALAIDRTRHLHARVGFEEGPQVANPLDPATLPTTKKFLSLWNRILTTRKEAGDSLFTITPEFGPPPYMPTDRHARPVADPWTQNIEFLAYLKSNLAFSPT